MSKLGWKKKFISQFISFEVKNFVNANLIWIQGPYQILKLKVPKSIILELPSKNNWEDITVIKLKNSLRFKVPSAILLTNFYKCEKLSVTYNTIQFSLAHVLINNALIASLAGFKRYLRVRGVGYKFSLAPLNKNILMIEVGYSHILLKGLPAEFVTKFSRKFSKMRVKSSYLSSLMQIFSHIRKLRKPDVYKGKGIRYKMDTVRKKEGKKKTTF